MAPLQRGERKEHLSLRNGQFVWLRSLVSEAYLHADEDGRGVSLRENRASRSAAWRVHLKYFLGGILLHLQGAAYGRYLAVTEEPALPGHRGFRAKQHDFDDPAGWSISWKASWSGWRHSIVLDHISGSTLRGNGYRWDTGVTIDVKATHTVSPMMHWVVEPIPTRDSARLLPGPRQIEEDQRREVRYVCVDRLGRLVGGKDWVAFQFAGRSVYNLRNELALRLGEEGDFTMFVRAGHYARLMPLVVDLPVSDDRLDIVILVAGSPRQPLVSCDDTRMSTQQQRVKDESRGRG